ncbi:hypothetical protein MA04_03096 [Alcanivorax balearicus MACL04]|uniref:Uncharacterized protein n=1 Tax=Alloalcanivorax balearicus MACL04 TaxID=1177182 RepID=A0ABT2R1Y1_9GAMM|nr:hypothetical protein [Alloalcanivorax balearicus]MCU5783796.1 hypothetical protein [Alloalcanivorax balearicus MACL04]
MGELKELREERANLVNRAKSLANTLYLASLGAYSKANEKSEELYGHYLSTGAQAYGDEAEGKSKLALASRGLFLSTRQLIDEAPQKRQELYENLVAAGKEERGEKAESSNEFVLAGVGAISTVREQGQKLLDELVSAGEKERA